MDDKTCIGTKVNGESCTNPRLVLDSPYCFSHHPDTAGKRAEGQRKRRAGEKAARKIPRPKKIDDLSVDTLTQLMTELREMKPSPAQATALTSAVKALEQVQEARKQTKIESVRVLTIEYVRDWRSNADIEVNADA